MKGLLFSNDGLTIIASYEQDKIFINDKLIATFNNKSVWYYSNNKEIGRICWDSSTQLAYCYYGEFKKICCKKGNITSCYSGTLLARYNHNGLAALAAFISTEYTKYLERNNYITNKTS